MKSYPFTNWDEYNPWADSIIYVPLDELADCIATGTMQLLDGTSVPFTKEILLNHWKTRGEALDGYILPQPSGYHSLGVRYGKEGREYFSYDGDKKKIEALLRKYS